MTKLFINDLRDCKALDMEAQNCIRGGHANHGYSPLNIEELLARLTGILPGYPMPGESPKPDGGPYPVEPESCGTGACYSLPI